MRAAAKEEEEQEAESLIRLITRGTDGRKEGKRRCCCQGGQKGKSFVLGMSG